jgi:hypothetical protein
MTTNKQLIKNALTSMNLEMTILLSTQNIKDKDSAANWISYFHVSLLINTLLSFWYQYTFLHYLNMVFQIGTYTDWFYNAYSMAKYSTKNECIVTKIENILRSEATRERNSDKKALEEKEKPKLKNGYIKTIFYEKTGYLIPDGWIEITIHTLAGMSLMTSYGFIF